MSAKWLKQLKNIELNNSYYFCQILVGHSVQCYKFIQHQDYNDWVWDHS